jgi:hypothetical protein
VDPREDGVGGDLRIRGKSVDLPRALVELHAARVQVPLERAELRDGDGELEALTVEVLLLVDARADCGCGVIRYSFHRPAHESTFDARLNRRTRSAFPPKQRPPFAEDSSV